MNNQPATVGSALTCPKCQSFDVREVSLDGAISTGFPVTTAATCSICGPLTFNVNRP